MLARWLASIQKASPGVAINARSSYKNRWRASGACRLTIVVRSFTTTCPEISVSPPPANQEDWHAFNFVVDVCFLVDLVARFLTAYHDDYADRMVYEPMRIARHYSRGLLVFDLIASVPLTIVSFSAGRGRGRRGLDRHLVLLLDTDRRREDLLDLTRSGTGRSCKRGSFVFVRSSSAVRAIRRATDLTFGCFGRVPVQLGSICSPPENSLFVAGEMPILKCARAGDHGTRTFQQLVYMRTRPLPALQGNAVCIGSLTWSSSPCFVPMKPPFRCAFRLSVCLSVCLSLSLSLSLCADAGRAHIQHLQQGREAGPDAADDEVDTLDQAAQRGGGEDPPQEHPSRDVQLGQGAVGSTDADTSAVFFLP